MSTQCQLCGKAQATVHLTDIAKGQKTERHLCNDCAEEEGVVMKTGQAPLNEILSKFVMQKANVQELADLTCDNCGLTFVEFRSSGLLGCPNDYDAFKRGLEPLIERTHEGALQHVGKVASKTDTDMKASITLMRLNRELQVAVDNEKYEEAARLRDEIKKLESS